MVLTYTKEMATEQARDCEKATTGLCNGTWSIQEETPGQYSVVSPDGNKVTHLTMYNLPYLFIKGGAHWSLETIAETLGGEWHTEAVNADEFWVVDRNGVKLTLAMSQIPAVFTNESEVDEFVRHHNTEYKDSLAVKAEGDGKYIVINEYGGTITERHIDRLRSSQLIAQHRWLVDSPLLKTILQLELRDDELIALFYGRISEPMMSLCDGWSGVQIDCYLGGDKATGRQIVVREMQCDEVEDSNGQITITNERRQVRPIYDYLENLDGASDDFFVNRARRGLGWYNQH